MRQRSVLLFTFLLLFLVSQNTFAQPFITSFTPASGPVGTTVTITGTGFNTTAANNIVFFGATSATVSIASATSLSVLVPAGASHARITVLNTVSHLLAYSKAYFQPTFSPVKNTFIESDLAPIQAFTTGGYTVGAAIGDLDGDGKPDIVTADVTSKTVTIYNNTSSPGAITSGSFTGATGLTTSGNPEDVLLADINTDGKLDVLTINSTNAVVGVYLNTSSGAGNISFAAAQDFAVAGAPTRIAVGDFDGDGMPDIVTSSNSTNNVSVLRNTGSGGSVSFASHVEFAVGTGPVGVVVGDLDGDGAADIIAVNNGSSNISVLRNIASSGSISGSSFEAAQNFGVGGNPNGIAIGDINSDNKLDISTTFNAGSGVYLSPNSSSGTGNINFGSGVGFSAGSSTYWTTLADMNGDGKLDVLATDAFNIYIRINNTSPGDFTSAGFSNQSRFTVAGSPRAVVGDLDGDGRPDIIGTNGTISILRNVLRLTPVISTISPIKAASGSTVTISGTNFNATTSNNIVFFGATKATVSGVTGTTTLTVTVPAGAAYGPVSVMNTAYNTLGYSPQFFRPISATTKTSFNSGDLAARVNFTTGTTPNAVSSSDIDGDGKADIVTLNSGANSFSVLLNTSTSGTITSGSFGTKTDISTGVSCGAIAVGDVNGDGKPDIVTGSASGSSKAFIFINTSSSGSVSFASAVNVTMDSEDSNPVSGVKLVDLDGDGKLDIIGLLSQSNSNIAVVRNIGTPGAASAVFISFPTTLNLSPSVTPRDIAAGDLNSDGKVDFVVTNYGGGSGSSVTVFTNTSSPGAISFATQVRYNTGTGPYNVALGDLDSDGLLDIITSNYANGAGSAVSVLRNTGSTFATAADFTTGSQPRGLALSDMNGDGKLDIVTSSVGGTNTNSVSVLNNTSSGGISFAATTTFGTGTLPAAIAINDLDGDGKPDVLAVNATDNTVSVLRNTLQVSADATLSALTASAGTISPAFTSGTVTYISTVANATTSITVTPTMNDTNASIQVRVNGGTYATVTSGNASGSLSLNVGGNPVDVMVTAEDGTTVKTYTITVTRSLVPPGKALALTRSSSQRITVNNTLGNVGTGNFTLEAWVRTPGAATAQAIITKRSTCAISTFLSFAVLSDGRVVAEIDGGNSPTYTAVTSTATVSDNRWHHVAAVRNGTALSVFVDGKLDASLTVHGAPNMTNSDLLVIGGVLCSSVDYFNGSIDEVRIYDTALTEANIAADMTSANAAIPGNLQAYYDFDDGSGSTLADRTGNGNNGTLLNAPSWVESYAMVAPVLTAATGISVTGMTVNWTAPLLGTVNNYVLEVASDAAYTSPVTGSPFTVAGTSKAVTGLNSANAYYRVRADKTSVTGQGFNAGGVQSMPLGIAATNITFAPASATSTTINWTNGNGASRVVFMKAGTSGTPSPVDGTTYTDGSDFGSGTQIGSTGWYSVYNGSGSSVTVTGLTTTTTAYRVMVVEYSGSGVTSVYLTQTNGSNPANADPVPPIAGFGTAAAFNGANAEVSIPSIDISGTSAISIAAWVKSSNLSNDQTILRQEGGSLPDWFIKLQDGGNQLNFGLNTSDRYGEFVTPISSDFLNKWHYVVATYDGSYKRIYVDGTEIGNTAETGTMNYDYATQAIGHTPGGSEYFTGNMDEVSIWSKTLSETEIQTAMYQPFNGNEAGLLGLWKFNEASGTTANDSSPGGLNGTLNNTTRVSSDILDFGTNEDTPFSGTLTGSDMAASALTYSVVAQGTKGTVAITNISTGTFTYTPTANTNGSDNFTFKVNNGLNNSVAATVNVAIAAVNDDVPVLTSSAAASITPTTVALGGDITFAGDAPVTERGIVWGTSANPTTAGNKVSNGSGTGSFSATVNPPFTAGTTYHYRAYATNSIGTGYGGDSTFITVSAAPLTPVASSVTTTGFSLNWTAVTGAASYKLDVSLLDNFSSLVSGYNDLTVSGTSKVLTGLSAGTNYYFRLRAVNASGTGSNSTTGNQATTSSDATLSGIALSTGTLSPVFASGTVTYAATVPGSTSSITLTPTSTDGAATIKVNNVTVGSGSASGSITLVAGSNTIITEVTAGDGITTKTYTLAVNRAGSADATLSAIALSTGTLAPVFTGTTTNYTATVPYSTSSVTLTPTRTDGTATIKVNDITVTSGSASGSIALNTGANTITTVVTAGDGITTKTYTVIVTRTAAASIASLSGLTLSAGTLSPAFTASNTAYTAYVNNATSSITVTPTKDNAGAAIKVNGTAVTSGSASGNVAIPVGTSTVTVLVTAEDGSTTKTYTVKVTRVDQDQILTDQNGNVTTSNSTPEVVVTSGTQAITVTVPAGATIIPTVVYGSLITGGTGTVPQTTINSPLAKVEIPASTTITGSGTNWDGTISTPRISDYTFPAVKGQTITKGLVIEVGSPDFSLTFTKAVRLVLFGQAGMRIARVHSGVYTEITTVGTADTQAAGDLLAADQSFKINAGADLVIWTKGFSQFITFSQTTDLNVAVAAADLDAITAASISGANTDLTAVTSPLVLPVTGTGGSTVTWVSDKPAIISNDGKTVARPIFGSGNATVTLTVTTTKGTASETKAFTIIVAELPNQAPTLAAVPNQTLCFTTSTQTIVLSGITAGPESGQLTTLGLNTSNPGLLNGLAVNSKTGLITYIPINGAGGTTTITVTVKDNGGTANGGTDTFSRTFTITVNPLPLIVISSSTGASIGKGFTAELSATGGTSYSWSTAAGIISGHQTGTLTVRPSVTTTYTVTGTNATGCVSTTSFTLNVAEDYKALEIPNILTPNGDGKNDKLVIKNLDMYPNNTVKIFDRSGRELYVKQNYTNDWDGTFQGAPLAEDTYYYIVDFGAGRVRLKGFVSIVR